MWLDWLQWKPQPCRVLRGFLYCPAFQCRTIHFSPVSEDGSVVGPSWTLDPLSDCWLYGILDSKGEFTGPNIAFIYPDNLTAYLGHFEKGIMQKARPAVVVSKSVSKEGVVDLKLEIIGERTFSRQPSTQNTFGNEPEIQDPYESRMVYVAQSGLPCAGEGLFARQDVPPRTLLAFYNGYRIPWEGDSSQELYALDEDERQALKAYTIKAGDDESFYLDIPLHIGTNRSLYSGSLGHKVNHSFTPNCRYGVIYHPRWGKIVSVSSSKPIAQGEELFCNYGYNCENPMVPTWYRKLHDEFTARES